MANLKNTKINDTGFLQIPTGSSAQRPSNPTNGEIRYNSELKYVEQYDVEYGLWFPAGFVPPIATGGTITDITQGGVNYRVHTFTSDDTFEVTRGGKGDVLVVAGGGGAGFTANANSAGAGGGGAGGLIFEDNFSLSAGLYTIVVGAGGDGGEAVDGFSDNGGDSEAFGLTAIGGGGAGTFSTGGGILGVKDGGSGGGVGGAHNSDQRKNGGQALQPSSSSGGFGSDGGSYTGGFHAGGGGGGAGTKGGDVSEVSVAGDGGDGVNFSAVFGEQFGDNGFFAGGGGGSAGTNNIKKGLGGLGGGGDGANSGGGGGIGDNAIPNTGGGGGASGGDGGSGIVIIRYRTS